MITITDGWVVFCGEVFYYLTDEELRQINEIAKTLRKRMQAEKSKVKREEM